MADLKLVYRAFQGDVELGRGDLVIDETLETAILVSLFTDRRVSAEELPQGETSRRGFWGDMLEEDGDEIGSKLWLLDREKESDDELLARAEEYSAEALRWLVDDGIASSVEVETELIGRGQLGISVAVIRPDGVGENYRFNTLWERIAS